MRALKFLAVVLTALALVPGGAHLFSLPNKIHLTESNYFVVQNMYRGWALFGIVLFGALFANLALAWATRGQRAFAFVLVNLVCLVANLVIFFAFTFPANQATNNWTEVPADWQQLRWQWEVSHAVNAVITFLGFCSLAMSVLVEENNVTISASCPALCRASTSFGLWTWRRAKQAAVRGGLASLCPAIRMQLNSGSERNLVVHVVALAAGAGHCRLALA